MNDEDREIVAGLRNETLAEEVGRLASTQTSEDLYREAQRRLAGTVREMAEIGKRYAAIREREKKDGEGGFKKFFDGKRLHYKHALHFIHCAEILDRHPTFANLKSSRALHQLFSLTKPNQDEIAESLADVPLEEFDHMARGEIALLHAKTTGRKAQQGGRGNPDDLYMLDRWTKEIEERKKKIWKLVELGSINELDPRLKKVCDRFDFKNDEISWRLRFPSGDIPFRKYDPWAWQPSNDDGAEGKDYLSQNPDVKAAIEKKIRDRAVIVTFSRNDK